MSEIVVIFSVELALRFVALLPEWLALFFAVITEHNDYLNILHTTFHFIKYQQDGKCSKLNLKSLRLCTPRGQ